MNRIGFLVTTLLLLCSLTCISYAEGGDLAPLGLRNTTAIPVDGGGTYCAQAVQIDSLTTSFSDSGYLDLDNDCANPFGWPYNEVFYKFKPAFSRTYIFKVQVFAPSTKAAILIKANACCAGGTVVAMDTNQVAADCDTAHTTYIWAEMQAGTWYWIHVGDMSPTPHDSRYKFQMMYVPCPNQESTTPHNTFGTAEEIALNDSIQGDSSTFGHSDYYKFTLAESDSVIISEVSRGFGHCNSGHYPFCETNPLISHFFVYCDTLGHAIAEAHGELCSDDAQARLCLPAGTYYIKIENYGGESWVGWDYILILQGFPNPNCAPLPNICGSEQFLCPTGFDSVVTLTPIGPPPGPQHVQACVRLDTTHVTTLVVPVNNAGNVPTVTVSNTCSTCTAEGCQPLVGNWTFNPQGWVFHNNPARFVNTIIAVTGASGCCVCVTLDFVLPVELTSFSAVAGDGQISLNWMTASENNNDHFEVTRDGNAVAEVRGAGTSTQQHNYRWTDQGLTNSQEYHYTLVTVDGNGNRVTAGTLTASPKSGPAVVTEYALRQNYPNPFNPSTSISFDLPEAGNASLKIFNLMGQEVVTLVNGTLPSGRHEVRFDASTLPSGIYLYRLSVNGFVAEKKMLLMK